MKNHERLAFHSMLSKGLLLAAPLLSLALTGCKDSEFDEYYARPSWLESPAIDILEGRGDCKIYLELAERTLFSKQLEGSGSYTFFVPTDDAFAAFFADNEYGYKSAKDIPDDMVADIISSTMFYNQYPCDSLGNVLAGYNTWTRGGAYKHQTPAYEVMRQEVIDGDSVWVYDSKNASWSDSWHNYRHLPCFTDSYFKQNSVLSSDYSWFFPLSTWSSFGNVLAAQIVNANANTDKTATGDLYCENGVIHLIDKVVLPLKNLDAMICDYGQTSNAELPAEAQDGAWSHMRDFLYHKTGNGDYQFLTYTSDVAMSHYYEDMFPNRDLSTLVTRLYNSNNAFPLNLEDYNGSVEGNTAFNSGYTLFLPTASVMEDYVNNRILSYTEHGSSDWNAAFNELSSDVLTCLISSLFSDGIIWPSQFGSAQNAVGYKEFINGGNAGYGNYADVFKSSAFASNGLFHIVNFFPKTAAFEGIGSRFLLDPDFSITKQLYMVNYATSVYSHMLFSKYANYNNVSLGVILASNTTLKNWCGLSYNDAYNQFRDGNDIDRTSYINTMSMMSYFERDSIDAFDLAKDPLNGAYGGWAYTTSAQGNLIRYKKTGNMINGKPEIIAQSAWALNADPAETELGLLEATAMPQTQEPTAGFYSTLTEDPTHSDYVNGKVYVLTDQSTPIYGDSISKPFGTFGRGFTGGARYTLETYLYADSLQATPKHSIFKKYWEKAQLAATAPAFSSGLNTVLVPTDEALRAATMLLINGEGCSADDAGSILKSPEYMASHLTDAEGNEINWADTCALICNVYLTTTDCFPDDGLKGLYTRNLWSAPNTLVDLSAGYPISTSCKPMTEEWEDLMSGTSKMSMRISKVGSDNQIRFLGKDFESGDNIAVKALNASDFDGTRFSNTIVRELGQSNIMGTNTVIHSLNGFVIYKIQKNPTK